MVVVLIILEDDGNASSTINPEILEKFWTKLNVDNEGCLEYFGYYGKVESRVKNQGPFKDCHGKTVICELKASGPYCTKSTISALPRSSKGDGFMVVRGLMDKLFIVSWDAGARPVPGSVKSFQAGWRYRCQFTVKAR